MTYRIPLALWACAIAGLVVALATDGFGDVIGVGLTSVPALVLTRALVRALRAPGAKRGDGASAS
jgi:hypothetical protein